MTIQENLKKAIKLLKENNIQEPIMKARILLLFVLNKDKTYLIAHEEKSLNKRQEKYFEECINRLIQKEPLQHITGKQEFMKHEFIVSKDVLIPRQDTEILVEEVIDILEHKGTGSLCFSKTQRTCPLVLDLCTGSGIIAISLANYVENVEVWGVDVSEKALDIARKNANGNVYFIKSDLFNNIDINTKFDIIVSNPPYIKEAVWSALDEEVQKEPKIALDGGKDGLDFYRKIIVDGYKFLKPNGYLCLEIGYDQKKDVINLIKNTGKYDNIYSKKDLSGKDRIVICRFHLS